MISHQQRVSLFEFLYRKPGVELPEAEDAPEVLENLIQNVFDDLQLSKMELRQQVANLQARNKELEAYARMVAHDLKDPLTVLVTTSNLIIKIPNLTRNELKGYLQQISSTSFEMNRIINNLLLFAEASKAEAPLEPVQMAQVVANVQDRLSHMIEEQQAQIIIPKVWPNAIGYAPWLEEVWANYLSNAIKHGGNPPRVELGASAQPDGMVRFWTRDEGPGLPPKVQAHLFKPISQIDPFGDPGHGLGLSIVFAIVEKLGGQVGVESQPGQGSLFFFTLPAELSHTSTPATPMP